MLPSSPRKRKAVLSRLAVQSGLVLRKDSTPSRINGNAIEATVRDTVAAFYESDKASRATPGRKEVKVVKIADGTTVEKQTRYLLGDVLETFTAFRERHPDMRIGKSSFASLRPVWVRVASETRHNVCLCVHHENFEFILKAISGFTEQLESNSRAFLKQMMCDVGSFQCASGACVECSNSVNDCAILTAVANRADEVTIKHWSKTPEKRCTLQLTSCELGDCVTTLRDNWLKFRLHCFIQKSQSMAFAQSREEILPGCVVLEVENLNFESNTDESVRVVAKNFYVVKVSTSNGGARTYAALATSVDDDSKTASFQYYRLIRTLSGRSMHTVSVREDDKEDDVPFSSALRCLSVSKTSRNVTFFDDLTDLTE